VRPLLPASPARISICDINETLSLYFPNKRLYLFVFRFARWIARSPRFKVDNFLFQEQAKFIFCHPGTVCTADQSYAPIFLLLLWLICFRGISWALGSVDVSQTRSLSLKLALKAARIAVGSRGDFFGLQPGRRTHPKRDNAAYEESMLWKRGEEERAKS
jgi:hypothetical protein